MFAGIFVGSIIVYSVGVLTGVYVGYSIRKHTENRPKNSPPSPADTKKILDFARENGKVTNDDVQSLLKVSDSTAQRYLSKLTDSGKLTRHGRTIKIYYKVV